MATRSAESTACSYVVGADGLARWPDPQADAWIGLLEVTKRITRELDAELEANYGLGLSSLELLGRLAAAENRRLRLSTLAGAANLSLSRVSRIVDSLQARGLVERRQCQRDARAVEAELTASGHKLALEAQSAHLQAVQERFFSQLDEQEIATLAAIFARLAPQAAAACTASS